MYKYLAQRRHCGRPDWSTEPVWVHMKTNSSISVHVTPQNSLATPRSFPSTVAILPQPTKWSFNSNKSPTRCNNFSVYYPDVYLQLYMFRAFSRPSSGAQWLQWKPLVLPSYRGDSRAVFVVGPVNTQKVRLSLTFGTGVLHLIQINHQPDANIFQFIILTFVYSSTCFGRFPTHH